MITRRLAAAAVAALGLAVAVPGTPASAQWEAQPVMVGDNDVSVVRGDHAWINVIWTAPVEMENFRMVVQEFQDGTETDYADGADAAHLQQDSTLVAGELDIASFELVTGPDTPETFFIQVIAEWEHQGETFRYYPGGLNVRVVDNVGDDFALLNSSATVSSGGDGSSNWVELDFLGLTPVIDDLKIEVAGELDVQYPQETYTSLHHGSRLLGQERDVARFWIDPANADPGMQDVMLVVSYVDENGTRQSSSVPFTIEIL